MFPESICFPKATAWINSLSNPKSKAGQPHRNHEQVVKHSACSTHVPKHISDTSISDILSSIASSYDLRYPHFVTSSAICVRSDLLTVPNSNCFRHVSISSPSFCSVLTASAVSPYYLPELVSREVKSFSR